jgi:hypothetical protein
MFWKVISLIFAVLVFLTGLAAMILTKHTVVVVGTCIVVMVAGVLIFLVEYYKE